MNIFIIHIDKIYDGLCEQIDLYVTSMAQNIHTDKYMQYISSISSLLIHMLQTICS